MTAVSDTRDAEVRSEERGVRMIDSWEEWGKVHARLDFWRDEIRLICESNGIELHSLEPTYPGTHAVFFVNEDTVLKIFCPVRYNTYHKELRLHQGPLKENHLFPQIRFHGKSPSGYHYIAFTKIHGKPVREVGISEAAVRDLAYAIADLQIKTLERDRCLVHYDLTEDHVFLSDQGRLEGIIDFGDAKMAHPSDEFPALFVDCLRCDDSLIAAFREAYDGRATHYQVNDEDIIEAVSRHDYCTDIIAYVRRSDTGFARYLKSKV